MVSKNILPAGAKRREGRPSIFGWHLLGVGDYRDMLIEECFSARSAASTYKKRHPGWDYKSEKLTNGRIRFVRIS